MWKIEKCEIPNEENWLGKGINENTPELHVLIIKSVNRQNHKIHRYNWK